MKILENVEAYKVVDPMFEGIRVIMSYLGEPYSPQYMQGISGGAFRVATGCPSRPTCCNMMWITELIKLLGYEYKEYPCTSPGTDTCTGTGKDGKNLMDEMIGAVMAEIDSGKPALVWHAFTSAEWDVVCGYDEVKGFFFGRGSYRGFEGEGYVSEPWDRAAKVVGSVPAFGAVTIGAKTGTLDVRKAEIAALRDAVTHARTEKIAPEPTGWWSYEGLQSLRKWSEAYNSPGKERDAADAYCFQVYHSTHAAAPNFLSEIAPHFEGAAGKCLIEAAGHMEKEAAIFKQCWPYLFWDSPWGVNEERSHKVAPLLCEIADHYERAIVCLEKALAVIG
ncbi:MAG: hypothetical protein Q7J78_01420 [Clostridiales bacterium]|nr:hypothetical protein [Clostridiales bacterium]